MNHNYKRGLSLLAVTATMMITVSSLGQSGVQDTGNDSVKIAANTNYQKAGKFKRMMWGEHYRKDWAVEVNVEVLDLDHYAGGLTPVKLGGGLQTRSLRLTGENGKEYVLRSVNKNPSKAIDPSLRKTFAEDVVQDQISSSNPYAPMVVARLADAAGIFHTQPRLVYVPASERLGTLGQEFAETLCLLEARPAGDESDNPAYEYPDQIVNSEKLLHKVFRHTDHRVDEFAYVKARLFDMLIGDWDRHEDQWLWASFKTDEQTIYKPIPRDRDQAFSNLDGVLPQLMTRKWGMRKLQHYDYSIRDIAGLNMAGMALDRNFTTRLSLSDWLSVARSLQKALTDELIDSAFSLLPDPIYRLSGKQNADKLVRRRNDLQKYAMAYYLFLTEQVTIVGTDGDEIFEVKRLSKDSTSVRVYKSGKTGKREELLYSRIFLTAETKEIRLYGLEGEDRFLVDGNVQSGILIRLIGGKGKDYFTEESRVNGVGHQTKIYDDSKNIFHTGPETKLHISADSLKNDYYRKSVYFDVLTPLLTPGYNVDDGVFIGGGVEYRKQQFGKSPYGYRHRVSGSFAPGNNAYTMSYSGTLKEVASHSDLNLSAGYHSPTYSRNYYGQGNETVNLETETTDYYRVRMSELYISADISRQIGEHHVIEVGSAYHTYHVENTPGRFISTTGSKLDSANFGRETYVEAALRYVFSTIDNALYPTKGIHLESNANYVQHTKESGTNYVKLSSELASYRTIGRFTLASRIGFATNTSNDYNFYQANYLGGTENLRGYRKQRFTGKTSVYQNSELRFEAGNLNIYLTKGAWGLLAFADNGKVWMPGETSKKWHRGYGGGFWFLPFNKMAFTATYGVSKEDQLVNISAGFTF